MDDGANKLESGRMNTPVGGLDEFIQKINSIVQRFQDQYVFAGLAVSSPGAVDTNTGYIGGASAIPFIHDVNMIELLEKETGLPVSIENDANCAALAEGWLGAAKDTDYYICIVIGTGIGGSIVMNHSILRGASLHGGEFGYMLLGESLMDPQPLNWSRTSSTNALVREVEKQKNLEMGVLNGKLVFDLVDNGDVAAIRCVEKFYKTLATGIFNLKYILDPEKILIGGGISKRQEVINGINQELKKMKNETATLEFSVEACHFDNDANLIGALFHFLKIGKSD